MNNPCKLCVFILLILSLASCTGGPSADVEQKTASRPVAVDHPSDGSPLPMAAEASFSIPERNKVAIDYSCTHNAQCAIKDIGSCCGYRPACVNVDSPTDPEAVQAACANEGRAGVCGFPSISACQCVDERCTAVNGPGVLPNAPNDKPRPILRDPQGDQ